MTEKTFKVTYVNGKTDIVKGEEALCRYVFMRGLARRANDLYNLDVNYNPYYVGKFEEIPSDTTKE